MPILSGFPAWLRPATFVPVAGYLYFLFRYRSVGYGVVGLAVLALFFLLYASWEKAGRKPLGILLLIALGLGLPALGTWQFLHFGDMGDLDHSSYANALWNFRHGFWNYDFRGINMLGVHSQYNSFLWIPLHALGGELGLKIGKALCLLFATILVIRRFRQDRALAAWAGSAILLSPPVASQFFFGFHPEFIAAPVLVLLLEAYREEKLSRFLACTAFLAFSKEVFTLAVGGVLLVALVERRPWKWIFLPGILCCLQMAVYWFVIVPRFAPAGNHLGHYLPASPSQLLTLWPRRETFFYVLHVFLPFLPLLLAFPKRYLLIPLPMMIFYASFPDTLFMVMWPNYAFPLAFLCSAGLILSPTVRFLNAGVVGDAGNSRSLDGRILAACAVTSLLCYPLWREIFSVPSGNPARVGAVDRIRARIPEDAKVVVNGSFTARFSARKEVSVWGWRTRELGYFDYAVVDARFKPNWLVDEKDLAAGLDTLFHSPHWKLESAEDSLFVFRCEVPRLGIARFHR